MERGIYVPELDGAELLTSHCRKLTVHVCPAVTARPVYRRPQKYIAVTLRRWNPSRRQRREAAVAARIMRAERHF
jgi:hypothetical protein